MLNNFIKFVYLGPGVYQVVKCGSFGHNIRCRPKLKATPIGMLTHGDRVTATEDVSYMCEDQINVENLEEM